MAHDQPNPSRRAWKDAVQQPAPASGKRAWQQSAPAKPAGRKRLSRAAKLGLAAAALGAICGLLVWVVFLLRAPRPACLILIGAGYEDNLAIPHNAAGWKGLNDLKDFALSAVDNGAWLPWQSANHLRLQPGPERITAETLTDPTKWEDFWARNLDGAQEKTLIVFLALHGGADDKGPYLFADDPTGQAQVRIEKILDELDRPALKDRNKVLILDATQVNAHWPAGMFHNDFTRRLKALEGRIKQVPKLVVLCASDVDQQSWVAEEWQQTVFTHYVLEGLRGGADSDGNQRVTAWELYQYVRDKVEAWTDKNRDAVQTPLLLGDVEEAKNIDLLQIEKDFKERSPQEAPNLELRGGEDLRAAWKKWETLNQSTPHPAVYSPHLWRQYQDTLLRYEQLVALGDPTGKKGTLRDGLNSLDEKIRKGQRLLSGFGSLSQSLGNAVPMPATLGVASPWSQKELQAYLARLSARDSKAAWLKEWNLLAEPIRKQDRDSGTQREPLLRLQLSQLLLQNAATTPVKELTLDGLKRTAAQLQWLSEGQPQPRCAEAHFLIMLLYEPLVPPQPRPLADLQLAIQVRLLAEKAALGDPASGPDVHPYSEVVWNWVQGKVETADKKRRFGEDWLFGSQEQSWANGRENLKEAKTLYQAALNDGRVVQGALAARDRALAVLPYYARWAAGQRLRSADDGNREQVLHWVQHIDKIGKTVDALADRLKTPRPAGEGLHQPLAGGQDLDARSLEDLTRDLNSALGAVQEAFLKECQGLRNVQQQEPWHKIQNVLEVPFLHGPGPEDRDLRIVLLDNARHISAKLHEGKLGKSAGRRTSAAELAARAREQAQRQGIMALTVAGLPWSGKFTREQLHKNVFEASTDGWRDTLTNAGGYVKDHWRWRLEKKIQQGWKDSLEQRSLEKAANLLQDSEHFCRWVEGGAAAHIDDTPFDPVQAARQLRAHDLLVWQARRTVADHWYLGEETPKTYYIPAATGYLRDAQQLAATRETLGAVNVARKKLAATLEKNLAPTGVKVVLKGGRMQPLIGDQEFQLTWEFNFEEKGLTGIPMAWLQVDNEGAFQVKHKDAFDHLPLVREDGALPGPKEPSLTKEYPLISELLDQSRPPPLVPKAKSGKARLQGVFRGQRLISTADVNVYPAAELIVTRFPPPPEAQVAVQLAPDTSYGALCIVLDFSGSMKDPLAKGQVGRKIDHVEAALRKVLADVPAGTYLSLLVFGRDERPPTMFHWVRDTKEWHATKAEINALIGDTFALQPLRTSPIAEALYLGKRRGFPRNFQGPKVLLALTDGTDTDFAATPYLHKLHNTANIRSFIKEEFSGSGIEVNLVCFSADRQEIAEAKRQFDVIDEVEPRGLFQELQEADRLQKTLEEALRPKMRLYQNDGTLIPTFRKGLLATRAEQNLLWRSVPVNALNGKDFEVDMQSFARLKVRLRPGQRLLLTIERDAANAFRVKRSLFAKLVEKNRPAANQTAKVMGDRWLAAVLQNKIWHQEAKLEQLLTFEDVKGIRPTGGTLENLPPGFLWLKVTGANKQRLAGVRWRHEYGFPAPAFRLHAGLFGAEDTPQLSAWWISEANPEEPVARKVEYKALLASAAKDKALSVGGTSFTVEKVQFQDRYVTAGPDGQANSRIKVRCLMVQVRYAAEPSKQFPDGQPIWLQPLGMGYQGEEHHYYMEAGRYVAVFWGGPNADTEPLDFNVVSIADFVRQATQAQWQLGPPDPRDQGPSLIKLGN